MIERGIDPSSILGRTLTNLLQTRWSDPICHVEGLGEAFYCTVVLEFGEDRLILDQGSVRFWRDRESLHPLVLAEHRMETSTTPVGSSVLSVGVDRLGDLYILFHNGVFLRIDWDYGHYLWVGETSDIHSLTIAGSPFTLWDWWSQQPL